ncbi:hypothetical protein C8Q76DRAFT_758447 [Earliella scabrosa]|nr:hypothetical protein C8Q76DRAFT_758447 [Earliella scabrosa]
MPVCTLHLLSLSSSIVDFLTALLTSQGIEPVVISRVVRWIITPTTLSVDPLLRPDIVWDILLILPTSSTDLPASLSSHIRTRWTITVGVPSRILSGFRAKNDALLHPAPGTVPSLTGSLDRARISASAQKLELTEELRAWMAGFGEAEGKGAVSMLNLLAFKPGMKDEYLKYGAAFAASVGSRRGGDAKIVGTVIEDGGGKGIGSSAGNVTSEGRVWDEVALAHYPSIWHFADMLASEDYQAVNHRHRVGSLKDTFILCTTELGLPATPAAGAEKIHDSGLVPKL